MVGSLILMGLFASFVVAGLWVGDRSADTDTTVEPDDDDILVGDEETVTGSPDGDVFSFDLTQDSFTNVSIAAGGGDDLVDMALDRDQDTAVYLLTNATVDGGSGDDLINITSAGSEILGGDGDDTITSYIGADSHIFGGDGDDSLTAFQRNSNGVVLEGGAGNDVLIGTGMESGRLFGGDGDDFLSVSSLADSGAGYVVGTDGGAGNDTIEYSGSGITRDTFGPLTLRGGADADTFKLNLDEGSLFISDLDGNDGYDILQPDGTNRLAAVNIGDFMTGEDRLVIEADTFNDTFTLTTARIETVEGANGVSETRLMLRYESPEEATRDLVINFGASAVTWDDITFEGENIPQLIAA